MSENNIPEVTVSGLVQELGDLYTKAIQGGWPLTMLPTPFVWGPPGVGKSDGAKQLKVYIEKHTSKKVVVTDVRLLLFSPIDLRGIPVANQEKTFAEWLKPKIFDMDSSEDVINILFLDELTAAPPAVQAAAYQLTLDRRIGEHELPDNCLVIGAGNRTTDHSVAYRMPNALANRMQHYEVCPDFDSWSKWAMQNEVHPLVLGFLAFDNSKFYDSKADADRLAYATPRSWMFVSNILNILRAKQDISQLYTKISSCVGADAALAFITWCRNHEELPDVRDIFSGRRTKFPMTMDALYALIMSMAAYAENREKIKGNELTVTELENAVIYASRFPADYRACLYQSLCRMSSVFDKLMQVPGFRQWLKEYDLMDQFMLMHNAHIVEV